MRSRDPRAATLLELSDALTEQMRNRADRATAAWNVHVTYARRAATALHGNDLALALRCAAIATEAQHIYTEAEESLDPDARASRVEAYDARDAEYRASQRAARRERSERRQLVSGQ